jgi:hypothetical protein
MERATGATSPCVDYVWNTIGALRFLVLHIRSGISGTLEIKIFSSSPALIVRVLFM